MIILDTSVLLHTHMVVHQTKACEFYEMTRKHNIQTRFSRAITGRRNGMANGDLLLKEIQDLFYNGLNMTWSEVQMRIFNEFINACLPKIYGDEWDEVKQRVLHQRGLDRLQQEVLVNMARRNGKTYVTSGTAAVLFLVVPNLSIAVFSTGSRTARMLMTATVEKIEAAFNQGTHVKRQGYAVVQRNKEILVMEHPLGGKQTLGCYPGSVRVSNRLFFINMVLKKISNRSYFPSQLSYLRPKWSFCQRYRQ